jgi:cell filamentation protein
MSDGYSYIDSNSIYVDSKTGVLFNIPGLTNEADLIFYESITVAKRLEELYTRPTKIEGSISLMRIHHHLFQDVYTWAGETRTVNISKNGKPFFEFNRFQMGFKFIDSLVTDYLLTDPNQTRVLSEKLAIILDNTNFLHPFREGNGRTQREFIRLLALNKGYSINLNPADNLEIHDKYMQGTIESNITLLSILIFSELKKIEQ